MKMQTLSSTILFFLLLFAVQTAQADNEPLVCDSLGRTVAARPLFDDPIYHGPTDPMVCYNPVRKSYLMYYTARPANKPDLGWINRFTARK